MTTVATAPETLKHKALRWLREHRDARRLLAHFAEQMRARGMRFGMKALVERARWQYRIEHGSAPDHGFKINNSYTAYIARWLIHRDPRLADLVQLRATPAADLPAREPSEGGIA